MHQQSILPSPERFVYRRYSNRCHNNRHVDCGPLNERKRRRSLWNSVLFLHWGGIKLWTYGFLFHTAEQQKNTNAADIKKTHSQISALWRVVPKLAVCYTHLKCGNVYVGLHGFFIMAVGYIICVFSLMLAWLNMWVTKSKREPNVSNICQRRDETSFHKVPRFIRGIYCWNGTQSHLETTLAEKLWGCRHRVTRTSSSSP